MKKLGGKRKRLNILLYSAILSLMLGSNNFANAEDFVATVSSGKELKSVISNAKNPTKIQFANDIDITDLNIIPLGTSAIEIDVEGKSLINTKDSRFTFVDNSSLTLKNMKYVGNNTSINISNANSTITLENVAISGRKTSNVKIGPVLYLEACDVTLDNVSISSSRVNISNNSIKGGAIYLQTAKSKGIITDLIDNQITSAESVSGGLIYNRRTLTPSGELNLKGDVKKNQVTANNIAGGILNNDGSKSKSFCCKVSSPSIEKYSLR